MVASPTTPSASPFYVPIDLGHTALLLADIQDQIASRFSPNVLNTYLTNILQILNLFRNEIAQRRANPPHESSTDLFDNTPLIVHHIFPAGINSNAFISPYNKLARWFTQLEASGAFPPTTRDPNSPQYAVCKPLVPADGWGSKDEILIPKLTAGCFSSSELLQYLRARGIRHVVLCGLTTVGAVLGSARLAADMDFHVVVVREGIMDDDEEVSGVLLERVLPRFVDVVGLRELEEVFVS
jgi:nicotinamidase-related amidase